MSTSPGSTPKRSAEPKAARSEHAQSVRFVDHQPGAMSPRCSDEGRQIGDIAIHAVMALDDEQRAPVARPRLAQQPVGGFVVEMRKRHPAGAGKHRALNDAVVDQRVVNDHVVAAEQMPDDRDVGRMAADQDDAVFAAVDPRERLLELAVNRPLAGDRPAGRDRRCRSGRSRPLPPQKSAGAR